MMTLNPNFKRSGENGNVLFLILIAVVLFAALSYAVTQSSRTGGGDAGRETNLISSAEISQYPAAIKTAIVRMVINGTTYEQLKFNPPSAFSGLGSELTEGVFHPTGGGAAYVNASADVMASGTGGQWHFNPNFEVENIGTSTATSPNGNEFIAFLYGIKAAICTKINEEVGIGSTIPVTNSYTAAIQEDFDDGDSETIPNETVVLGASASGATELSGQAFGCFRNGAAGSYVYYQVIAER